MLLSMLSGWLYLQLSLLKHLAVSVQKGLQDFKDEIKA